MRKVFSDVREQISILKSKDLAFEDEQRALENLVRSNYYVVINGYRKPFLLEKNQTDKTRYIKGATFEEIFALYMFDRAIRTVFMKYILIIEQNIKSAVSYEFSKIYGHEDYLKYENFACEDDKNIRDIFFLMGSLHNSLSKAIGKNDYITYNIEKYNNVPLWVLANVITFNNIINFYKLMKEKEKKYIAKKYFRVKVKDLEDYMELLKDYRNRCAHDERIYDVKGSNTSIPLNEFHDYFAIDEKSQNGKRDVFALVIALCTLLSKDDERDFLNLLTMEFDIFEGKIKSIPIEKIYDIMGFPVNWRDIKNLNF